MSEPLNLSCAILAGGRSTRMGVDKSTIILAGQTLLERIGRLARRICHDIFVVGRTIPHDWPSELAVSFLPDEPSTAAGPIVGICTALSAAGSPVLILACDMPLLTESTLHQLIQAHIAANHPAATMAATLDDSGIRRAEPLLAIYAPAILPILQGRLAAHQLSLQQLVTRADVHAWEFPPSIQHELLNVNDPGALAQAQRYFDTTP